MAKLSHIEKVKLARKMMTVKERKDGTPIFQSIFWANRRYYITRRIKNKKLSLT